MALRCYMAITGADYKNMQVLPQHPAWMACQFSGYGTGLSNLPKDFPEGGMMILNDLTPIHHHDPEQICRELRELYETMSPSSFFVGFPKTWDIRNCPACKAALSGTSLFCGRFPHIRTGFGLSGFPAATTTP